MNPILALQARHASHVALQKKKGQSSSKKDVVGSRFSFSQLLETAEQRIDLENQVPLDMSINKALQDTAFEDALDSVFLMGEELKSDHGLTKLADYKKAVRNFLNMVLKKAYQHVLVKGTVNPRTMFQKEYSLIRVVNERLENLALAVLQEQEESLSLLARIDEIRGLIIDYLR